MSNAKIKLRPVQSTDASAMAVLANNKRIWDNVRNKMPYPYDLKDAKHFIGLKINDDPMNTFAITYNDDFCGMIGLHIQDDVYCKSAELGYWIGEPFWGKGIATQAVRKILVYGFDKLNLFRIYASTYAYNQGSMKVLEKNNFVKEGIGRKAVYKNDEFYDEHRFAKLKTD